MPRTDLNPTTITIAGIDSAAAMPAANVDGHAIPDTGRQFLRVKNASGAPVIVTVQTPITVGARAVPEDTVTVPAAGERFIGPFDPNVHRVASGNDRGKVLVDFSAVASVTCAAYTLP